MRQLRLARWILAIPLALLLSASAASAQTAAPAAEPTTNNVSEELCKTQRFSTVFRCLGHDIARMGTGSRVRWIGVGTVLATGSILLDDEVSNSLRDPDQDVSVAIGENLGEAGFHFGLSMAIYLAGRAAGHSGASSLGVMMFRTQVVNGIFTRGLKLVPRPRPYQEVATPTKGSFPSGHTSAAFATATVLHRRWGWKASVPAYLVASYVGATRLQNLHYLSDVTFGAALGIASGLAVDMPARRPAIAPMLAPGTAGVVVTIR